MSLTSFDIDNSTPNNNNMDDDVSDLLTPVRRYPLSIPLMTMTPTTTSKMDDEEEGDNSYANNTKDELLSSESSSSLESLHSPNSPMVMMMMTTDGATLVTNQTEYKMIRSSESSQQQSSLSSSSSSVSTVISPKSPWFIFVFSLFQFGICTGQAFSQAIYLPLQVIEYTGEEKKEQMLAIVGLVVALCGMLAGPISGYISDEWLSMDHSHPSMDDEEEENRREGGAPLAQHQQRWWWPIQSKVSRFRGIGTGRRTPFIIIGSILYAITFIVRGFLPCRYTAFFVLNAVAAVIGNVALVIVITAYLALIPELFPTSQMGLVSGINGFVNLISIGIAVALFGYLYPLIGPLPICLTIAAMILVNMVIQLLYVREIDIVNIARKPKDHKNRSNPSVSPLRKAMLICGSFLSPFHNLDFLWTFLTRFMFTLGTTMIQTFGLYFLKDKVGPVYKFIVWSDILKSAEQALAAFMVIILLSGMCSSITGGILSDKIGRKPVIMISGLLVSIGCVAMCFITNYNLILLFSIFVGLGSGSYYGTDLSLANDIIGTKEVAKSIAMFQLAQNLPTVLSSPLGGFLLTIGNAMSERKTVPIQHFGYNVLCAVASILTISSSVLVMLVRHSNVAKGKKDDLPNEDELQVEEVGTMDEY